MLYRPQSMHRVAGKTSMRFRSGQGVEYYRQSNEDPAFSGASSVVCEDRYLIGGMHVLPGICDAPSQCRPRLRSISASWHGAQGRYLRFD